MGTTVTPDKTGEAIRMIKFYGDKNKWPEWSVKVLAFAMSKEFTEGLSAFSDATFLMTQDEDVKEANKLNNRAYQFLILCAFGLVNMPRQKSLKMAMLKLPGKIYWIGMLLKDLPT